MGSNMELRINLGALKRQDPYIDSITDTSTHVAVYSFSPQLNEWEKTDVEGTLFVYRRIAPPYWGFTILNRLNMDNMTEPLTSELEFQTQNPFLLYRNAKLLIYGIWFYDQEDCKRIGTLLEKLCRESMKPVAETKKVSGISLFTETDNTPKTKDLPLKSGSPTSNSIHSISPGSSFGAATRPLSNGEADSESDDKEVAQSNKGSVDILDLLSKAQDKYEKEKRNTPDPVIESLRNGAIVSPTETELTLVKPLPVKPVHPQKLDVATLFKHHPPKPPDANPGISSNIQPAGTTPLIPAPMMNPGYAAIVSQPVPIPSSSVAIPQQKRPIGRSFSMTEMAMRQHLEPYLNGNVMSVEEIEAGISRRNQMTVSRQQQINSTLDTIIDRINSGGALAACNTGGGVLSQAPSLPGIQEVGRNAAIINNPSTGISGTIVNGNKGVYGEVDVFANDTSANLFTGSSAQLPSQTFVKPIVGPRQRSVSSSSIQQAKSANLPSSLASAVPPNAQLAQNFPLVPALPLHAVNQAKLASTGLVNVSATNPGNHHKSMQHLLLHGNQPSSNKPSYCVPSASALVSSVTTTVVSIGTNGQTPKVPVNAASIRGGSKSSPVLPTALISPEDFERSASTPQKKLELKQRLLQDVQQPLQNIATPAMSAQLPLTKEQLQQTLVSLLQKDSAFLSAVHKAYMTNFKQT